MRPPRSPRDFPVTYATLLVACGVARNTPWTWRSRGELPAVDIPLASEPVWWASTIAEWCATTGRPFDVNKARQLYEGVARQRYSEPAAPRSEWERRTVVRGGLQPAYPAPSLGWLFDERLPALFEPDALPAGLFAG